MRHNLALLLFIALSAGASAQELGTLFLTPKERAALDSLRRGEPAQPAGAASKEGNAPRLPAVTGYIKRSDGNSTVFLDKQPYPARGSRTQKLIEPRIVETFEPLPKSAQDEPAAGDGKGMDKEKPGLSKAAPTAASRHVRED